MLRLVSGLVLFALAGLAYASAAEAVTVTPNTWNIVGLDSNSPSFGPNRFPVGAKVCGGTAGATGTASFTWETGGTNPDDLGTYIYLRAGSSNPVSFTYGADGCADAYFEVEVDRTSAAFDKTRRYYITADGVSTPRPRELYVEHLISQSRNYITNVKLDGASIPAGGAMNLMVGNTYTIELYGGTATQGYNQFEKFINFPNTIFQILSVSTDYSANNSPYVSSIGHKYLYADACKWENDPDSPYYLSCVGGDYKSGGSNVVTTYTVKIVGGGGSSETLSTLLYDFSGASFHYNADYSTGWRVANIIDPASVAVAKRFSPNPTNVYGVSALTFTLTNPNAGAISGLNFTDVFPTSPGNMTLSDTVTSNTCGGTLTDDAGGALNAGDAGIRLTGGTAPANGSCTVQVNVTTDVVGTFNNASGNLYVDSLDTGSAASDSLTVNITPPPPAPPAACDNPVELARWTMDPSQGTGTPPAYYSKVSDVATATASYTGAGSNSIQTGAGNGNPVNSWGATGWPSSSFSPGNASQTPYLEFVLDTSNYGGVRIALDYGLLVNGEWAAGNNNHVYVYSSADSGAFSTLNNAVATKGNWYSLGPFAAAATGTNTTTFRINADTRNGSKPNAMAYFDNIIFTGCPRPDPPTITKNFSQNPVAVNGTSTLTFTITNPNACCSLGGVTFTDSFPTGLQVASPLSASTTCTGGSLTDDAGGALAAGDTGIKLSSGTIGAGAGTTCTVSVNVTAASAGTFDNVSGYVSSTDSGENTGSTGSASASLTALSPPVISKQFAPDTILANGTSTLTFLITNTNQNNALGGVGFTDNLPGSPGIMKVANPPNASTSGCGVPVFTPAADDTSLSFSSGTIAAGDTCTVTVAVTAPAQGAYDNTSGNVSHTLNGTWNGNTASDTLTVAPPNPAITLLKQVSTSAIGPWTSYVSLPAGSNVYYQFTVENAGDVPLTSIGITDPQVSAAGCVWPDPLPVADAADDDHIATCVVGPVTAAAGIHSNTATATGTYSGTPYDSDPSEATYATTGLTLVKSVTETYFIAEGNELNYSFTVTNSGSAVLPGPVSVSDDKTTVTCPALMTIGDNDNYLDPGEAVTCTATYTVVAGDVTVKKVTNTAQASTPAYGGSAAVTSNTDGKTVPLASELTAAKVNNAGGQVVIGGSFTWTLTVNNTVSAGTATFTDGQSLLTDNLPVSGATYTVNPATKAGATGTIDCSIASNTLTCAANGTVVLPYALAGTIAVENGNAAVAGTGTAFTTELSAGSIITISGVPYTVQAITNDTALTLTTTYAGATASGLEVPGSFSVAVSVATTAFGDLINPKSGGLCRADPGAVVPEMNDANNDCADTVTVLALPNLSVLKSANVATANPGSVIVYEVQILNSGGPGTNVVLRDDMSPYSSFCLVCYSGNPFNFIDGSPASGLSFGTPEYSDDNGSTWTYTPVDGGGGAPAGFDGNITNWRIPMTGSIDPGGGFRLNYQAVVK
jgi:hypothetical protein